MPVCVQKIKNAQHNHKENHTKIQHDNEGEFGGLKVDALSLGQHSSHPLELLLRPKL